MGIGDSCIIDGKSIAENVRNEIAREVDEFKSHFAVAPCIALINIGNDPASKIYVANKVKLAGQVGITSKMYELPENVEQSQVEQLILELNKDKTVHGILLQLPIPRHLDTQYLINLIVPEKDVDGLTWVNIGKLSSGIDALYPCTPSGIMYVLEQVCNGDMSGKHAVVIGRSGIVGKPMAQMLLNANCTVTVLHSKSRNVSGVCREADIVVAAVGKPAFITKEWIKPGAIVIDVGINRIEVDGKKKLVGDVDFHQVKDVVRYITPVPGGVGPLTVAFLMHNTLKAAKMQTGNIIG